MNAYSYINRFVGLGYRAVPGGSYCCPVCGTAGRLAPLLQPTGLRRSARCLSCGSLERHRLQRFALERAFSGLPEQPSVLHVAPEPVLVETLRDRAGEYVTGDLEPSRADITVDLRAMPEIEDGSFDLIFASHVMEHIDRDLDALAEVERVLKPGGCAVLPVPIVADITVEYGTPNPAEHYHVRAPGIDYFKRYEQTFSRVEFVRSRDVPDAAQTWVLEDRSNFPNKVAPKRPPQYGKRHEDIVPLCWSASTAKQTP